MKATRDYIKTIRKGLDNWTEWVEDGENLLKKERWPFFHGLISREAAKLRKLDAESIRIDILSPGVDGIETRLKLIDMYLEIRDGNLKIKTDKYGNVLGGIPQYILDTKEKKPNISDSTLNDEINEYRRLIEEKLVDLLKVFENCSSLLPSPKHPIVMAALNNPTLLAIFGKKDILEEYILFCIQADNGSQMAARAAILSVEKVIAKGDLNKKLHDELEHIGLKVCSYDAWKQETAKTRRILEK